MGANPAIEPFFLLLFSPILKSGNVAPELSGRSRRLFF